MNMDEIKRKMQEQAQNLSRSNSGANSGNDVGGDSTTNTADEMTNNLQNKTNEIKNKIQDTAKDKLKKQVKKAVEKSAKKTAEKTAEEGAKAGAKVGAKAGAQVGSSVASSAAGATASAGAGAAAGTAGTAAAGTAASATAAGASSAAGATAGVAATPVGWIILAVVIVVVLVLLIYFAVASDKDKKKDDYVVYQNKIINIESDWTERLAYSYYMSYADKSYYYTIDDDPTIKQAGTQVDVADKYAREDSFAMNVELIKFLDEELNKGFSMPEQFIKPVYNTCSTGESATGRCETKPLTDTDEKSSTEGDLIVKSQGYIQYSSCEAGENYCGIQYKEDPSQSNLNTTETISVSSWGFAPIIHYQSYTEKRWVQGLKVANVKYFDTNTEEYKECKYTECPQDVKNKLNNETTTKVDENGTVSNGSKVNTYTVSSDGKLNQTQKKVYLIDSVATPVGTVSNEVQETTDVTGEKFSNDVVITNQLVKVTNDFNSELLTDTTYNKNLKVVITYKLRKYVWDDDYRNLKQSSTEEECSFLNVFCHLGKVGENIYRFFVGNDAKDVSEDQLIVENGMTYTDLMTKKATPSMTDCKTVTIEKQLNGEIDIYGYFRQEAKNYYRITCTHEDGKVDIVDTRDDQYQTITTGNYTSSEDDKIMMDVKIVYNDGYGNEKNGIKCTKTYNTIYTVTGDYWSTEYKYQSNAPKTESIDDGKYITDYLKNYEVYISKLDWDDKFDGFTFEEIFELSLDHATEEIMTQEDYENDVDFEDKQKETEYYKILEQLYGSTVFLDREALIQSQIEAIENNLSEDTVGTLPLNTGSSEYISCLSKFKASNITDENGKSKSINTVMNNYANYYGIDVRLLYALAIQEGNCDIGKWTGVMDASVPKYGVFQMDKSFYGQTITAFNYLSNKNDTVVLNDASAHANIRFAAMHMAGLLRLYNGNLALALQAYNYGSEAMQAVIENYARASNTDSVAVYQRENLYNTGWLGYRETYKKGYGDPLYLEHVIRYLPTNPITFKLDPSSQYSSYDFKQLAGSDIVNDDNEIKDINDYLYWYRNKDVIKNNWNTFYPWKNSMSLTYTVKPGEFPINTLHTLYGTNSTAYIKHEPNTNASEDTISITLAKFLAALDGSSASDNLNLTEVQWKQKFAALFTAETGTAIEAELPDFVAYLGEEPALPINNVFMATKKYGKSIEGTDVVTRSNIGIKASAGTQVKAISGGTIISAVNGCVEIDHFKPNKSIEHEVITSYCGIEIDENINVGTEVTRGQVIGKVSGNLNGDDDEEMPGIFFALEIDGAYENAEMLLRFVQLTIQYEYSLNSAGLRLATNEITKEFNSYIDNNIEEVQQFLEDNKMDIYDNMLGKMSSVQMGLTCAFGPRDLGVGPEMHKGIDVGTVNMGGCTDGAKYCNHLFAPTGGVVVSASDGVPDTVGKDLNTSSGGNHVLMLYKGTDGNLYTVLFFHLTQGSVTRAFSGLSSPLIPAGGLIGTQGNSGRTTGTHIHIEVINYGPMSAQEFFTHARQYGLRAGLSGNTGTWCSNTSKRPCFMDPAKVFGITFSKNAMTENNDLKDISRVSNSLPRNAVGLGG